MTQTNFFTLINLFIATLFLTKRASCNSTPDSSYLDCRRPRNCSDGQDIHFPFFFEDPTPQNYICGYPGFNLSCNSNGNPILRIPNNDYTIGQIFYQNQSLRVSNAAVFDIRTTCIPPIRNISLLDGRFSLSNPNRSDLFLLYNCKVAHNDTQFLIEYKVDCFSGNGTTNWTMAVKEDDPLFGYALGLCKNRVAVPVEDGEYRGGENADLERARKRGFLLNWSSSNCSICEASGGRCGFNVTTYHFRCFCPDRPHAWYCPDDSGNQRLDLKIGLGIGLGGPLIAIIALMSLYFAWRRYKQRQDSSNLLQRDSTSSRTDLEGAGASVAGFGALVIAGFFFSFCSKGRGGKHDVEEFLKSYGALAPKRFSYSEIKKITKSFREKLGKGGYGEVFKGKLPDGSHVAVKVLTKSKTNGEDFINEVASISRTSHVNIVTLLGFCFEGSKRALIYEFMSGGSLEKYIYEESYSNDDRQLGWETLLDIAIGIARGLEYLHRGCNTRILHFDIKPHNILLDEKFCPKVSDFGLAKICPQRESIISMVGARGTAGYIAPEVFCRNFGGVSHKSDVYSYGMMVFEMVGGRKNIRVEVEKSSEIYFPHCIHKRLELGEDLGLCGTRNAEERQIAKKMILVSLWCIQTSPSDRPAMDRVVEMLQGSLESIPIPPKPYLSSPSGSQQISVSSSPCTSMLTGQISEQVIKEVMG